MPRIAALLVGFFAVVNGRAYAQATDSLEIRGTVLELGSDGAASLAVAGVEVSLIEFVHVGANVTRSPVGTTYTDPRGAYLFHPEHTGDYYVEIKKEGYRYASNRVYGASVKLDQAHPTAQSTFTLMRSGGSITGRVVDEDGQPVPNIRVAIQGPGLALPGFAFGGDATAVTATDGTFTAADVLPGPHVVRISSAAGGQEKVDPRFSPDDLKIVDEDLETTYWPGGTARPTASIPVSPGGSVSAGTIRIRKVPYYRVHVSVPRVECQAGEKWTFRARYSSEVSLERPRPLPCTNDFLVSNLRPGTYSFLLQKDAPAPAEWALASVDISSKNIEVALNLEPEAQIIGRIVAATGATLPPLDKIRVYTISSASGPPPASPDAEGKFVLKSLKFPSHRIVVAGLTKDYYVKEFRLNGASSPSDTVTLSPAANQLEIVIDDKPGVIAGTVTDGDKPAAGAMVRLYPKVPPFANSDAGARTDNQGRFQINGLTPGEYGVLALPSTTGPQPAGYAEAVTQLAARARTITVERGGTATVTLPLSDPLH